MSTRSLLTMLVSLVLFVCADVRGASSLRRYAPVRVTIDAPAVDAAPEQHEPPEVFDAFTWLLNATLSWQEPYAIRGGKEGVPPETRAQHMERRRAIVRDVLRVAMDSSEQPLFDGDDGRLRTALFMLAIMRFESSYDLRVDRFHCAAMPKGYCDGGAAWCMGQVHTGPSGYTAEGWTGPQLLKDRTKCARAQLHILQACLRMCAGPVTWQSFSPYASGTCDPSPIMESRWLAMTTWIDENPASL